MEDGRWNDILWQEKHNLNKIDIQCVTENGKPDLLGIYRDCRMNSNQSIYITIKGIMSSFTLIPNTDEMFTTDWSGTIKTYTCQNRFAQNNGVSGWFKAGYFQPVPINSIGCIRSENYRQQI